MGTERAIMNLDFTCNPQDRAARKLRARAHTRQPLPPQDSRDWLTPIETAFMLGCSVATVHRLRRGLILGVLPHALQQGAGSRR
jgi:hypothetical protein